MTTPAETAQTGLSVAQNTANDAGTEYVILAEAAATNQNTAPTVKPGTWVKVATATARDAKTAIENHAAANDNKPGTFVAIAASKWKPIRVTPETVTTLKLEDAK